MAEQDKPTLVPEVLNDLMDVDGTPSEGDGLAYSAGAWRPGVAAGLLPENGPALTFWNSVYSGANLADQPAINAARTAMTMGIQPGYDTYPGVQPVMGTWVQVNGSFAWHADEPGLYQVYWSEEITVNTAPGTGALCTHREPTDLIHFNTFGGPTLGVPLATATVFRAGGVLNFNVSQGMIDAGFGGFGKPSISYAPSGAERVNGMRFQALIQRHSPGSTFDYYAEI